MPKCTHISLCESFDIAPNMTACCSVYILTTAMQTPVRRTVYVFFHGKQIHASEWYASPRSASCVGWQHGTARVRAAARRSLLRRGCCWPPARRSCSSQPISPTRCGRSNKPAAAAAGQDTQTDARQLRKPFSAYYAGSGRKRKCSRRSKWGGEMSGGNVRRAAGPGPAKRRLMSTLAALSASDQPPIGIIIATSRPLRVCLSVCLSLPLHHAAVAPAVPCSLWRSRRSLS